MKKLFLVFIAVLACFAFVSCERKSGKDAAMANYNAAKKLMDEGEYDAARKIIDEAIAKYGEGALWDSLLHQTEPTTDSPSGETVSESITENVTAEPETTAETASEDYGALFDTDDDWLYEDGQWTEEDTVSETTYTQKTTTTTRASASSATYSTTKRSKTYASSKSGKQKTTVPTTRAAQTQPETTTAPDVTEAAVPKEMLDLANKILRQSALSRKQIIDRIMENGFSEVEAVYAADHCGADWNIQAFRAAKKYIADKDADGSSYSRSDVKNELQRAGFSESETSYAVNRIGVGPNAQTTEAAQNQTPGADEQPGEVTENQAQE